MGQNSIMRVLVIEDHVELANDIAAGLRDKGFGVDTSYDGDDGYFKATIYGYDVVVLDRDLPGMHGDDVCSALANSSIPARILMLTASGTVEDRVEGLGIGADDYLNKPFAFEELVARIRTLARRSPSTPPILVWKDINFDVAAQKVARNYQSLALSRKELGVLEMLMMAGGAVVSAEDLLESVWDQFTDPFTRTVTVTLSRLRLKLGPPDVIETVIGIGYRLT